MATWLSWCAANRMPAPVLPTSAGRRREHLNATRAVPRPAIDRALTRRDVPLREKTLWRMLYEAAASERSGPSRQSAAGTRVRWRCAQRFLRVADNARFCLPGESYLVTVFQPGMGR